MRLKAYEHLFGVNQGFDQVRRSLKHWPSTLPWARRDRAVRATRGGNTRGGQFGFLDFMAAIGIDRAGRLLGQRKARESKEEGIKGTGRRVRTAK